jgi:DNA-binding beta-propeller fold protein YncE
VGALMGEVKLPAALAKGGRGAYRLAAEGVAPAADVAVYVRDAQGRFVVDATGRPISTRTDAEGRFLFRGHLAHRGLTCFVLLAGDARGLRGFAAMRPRDWRTGDRLPLDPVSTMLAGWIDTSILGSQAQDRRPRSLDRLTTDAATVARETLARKLGSAWAGAALDWRAETCAAETARIKQEGGAVAGALDAVQRIMTLAGIDNSQVETATRTTLALQQPLRLAVAPDGAVYVAERYTGLVRRFAADGTVSTVLGSGSPTQDRFGSLYACALTFANGQLYVAPSTADRVYRISADGKTVEAVSAFFAYAPSRRPDADLLLQALAPGLGGSLLYGAAGGSGQPARILRLKRQDGRDVVTAEDGPPAWGATPASSRLAALAEADDGALWAVTDRGETWLREPGGGWRKARHAMGSWPCDILTMPGGSLLCSFGNAEGLGKQELRLVGRDGSLTPYAGEGTAGLDRGTIPAAGAHFKLPAGLAALPDGTVLVADSQNGLVRAIKDGMVSTWAGTTTPRGTIAAEATLNLPGGIMVDAQGRVLLTEVGANAVRRLEGGNLTLVAGGEMAYADSPNQLGLLDGPASLAPHGDGILIGEAYGRRLRKLHPDGRLEVLVGGGTTWLRGAPKADQRVVAKDVRFAELVSVTVDPQGRPVFAAGHESYERAQIWRLEDDGSLTWLAGAFDRGLAMPSLVLPEDPRDGKPAKEVPISRLAGLAYDRAGNLYLAEPAAARVHRISPDGVFNTFAGTGLFPTVAALKDGTGLNEADVPARQASLLMPMGLAIDAQDRVYIAEVGTRVGAVMAARLSPEFAEDMPIVEGRVRVVTPDGIAHVLAGAGSGQQRGVVRNPIGVAVSRDGRLYVVDNGTAQLKEIVVTR